MNPMQYVLLNYLYYTFLVVPLCMHKASQLISRYTLHGFVQDIRVQLSTRIQQIAQTNDYPRGVPLCCVNQSARLTSFIN
jgi:hypothetical protein